MRAARSAAAGLALAAALAVLPSVAPAAAQDAPPVGDGAWADLGADGPSGPLQGAWSGSALLVHDDATDAVWSADAGGGTWSRQPATAGPPGVAGTALAWAADRLWAFGGRTEQGADRGELWSWTSAGGWQRATAEDAAVSPGPRSGAALAALDGGLYLYGGRRSGVLRDDLWRYDVAAGTWAQLAQCRGDCPGPRADAGLVALDGALWLFGGEGSDGPATLLHRATADGTWERIGSGPTPPPATGGRLVALGGALLAVGGCSPSGPVAWRFVPGRGWRQLHPSPMAPAVRSAAVVADGQRVHQVGGVPCGAAPASTAVHVALSPGDADPGARVRRIGADATDPVALGAAVSRATFPAGAGRVAVLGTAAAFPDSLAGAPLAWGAGGADGPLLFSGPGALSPATAEELRRVVAAGSTVYLLGGRAALSEQVEADVRALGFEAVRLSGPSRVETAVAIAGRADRLRDLVDDGRRVLLADSRRFPDAVAAGGYAAAGAPVPLLLTPGDAADLHPAVRSAIGELGVDEVVLLGGTAALSSGVESAVRALGVEVIRVSGQSRDGTAAEVAGELWGREQPGQGYGFVAVGLYDESLSWAAALAAAPLAAVARAPLLALNPGLPDALPPATAGYLDALDLHPDRPGFAWVVGPAPDGAARALAAALGAR